MVFGWAKRLFSRIKREEIAAEREEISAEELIVKGVPLTERKKQAQLKLLNERMREEDKIIRELGKLQAKKYTLVRAKAFLRADLIKTIQDFQRLSGAVKKTWLRIRQLWARWRASGIKYIAQFNPELMKTYERFIAWQNLKLRELENEIKQLIAEQNAEAKKWGIVQKHLQEQLSKINEYKKLIEEELENVNLIIGGIGVEIKKEKDALEKERKAILAEIDELRRIERGEKKEKK
ncbi:hypothetical protein DRJ19_00780 [Candidatus Woesearchaeota archaeon]|nr:MAG: hypothetical protein DRJ19_00780 [Candidatus Woesearchaeota archaeon]